MKTRAKTVIVLLVGVAIGILVGHSCRGTQPANPKNSGHDDASVKDHVEIWTCSMHPQIRQPKPGQCPLCGMDLIPVMPETEPQSGNSRQITLSESARKLAEVVLAPVERRSLPVELRLVGKVTFDETRMATIAPRVPGRIDRLYANFIGVSVEPGDHLADLFSPDLISAQQELLQAKRLGGDKPATASLLNATRERLRLWGLTSEQITEIERSGEVRNHVTFCSPIGGIVTAKEVREGQYVEAGMRLFTVADLRHVWVQLDAYETDLVWLRYAQEVVFQAEAYPGESFTGIIAFIDPILDPTTRTIKVRVNVANTDRRLKPGMFVRAVVSAKVTKTGQVTRPDLRGKWISPMHPEIIKDKPGSCDVCGMPLVRAEELGYAAPEDEADNLPLVIPATAPLLTGKRAVVYVTKPQGEDTYEGREIVLGPRAGEYYLVREGLQEGELVVVNGAFKIDSSLQIQGRPSMMMMPNSTPASDDPHGTAATLPAASLAVVTPQVFKEQIDAVLSPVLIIAGALADDNLGAAATSATDAKQALAAVDMSILSTDAHTHWMGSLKALSQPLDQMVAAKDIESFRTAFALLSPAMARVLKMFGPVRAEPIYDIRCPMAFNDQGATWLQRDKAIRNPYFGKSMLKCGDVIDTIPPASNSTQQAEPPVQGDHTHE